MNESRGKRIEEDLIIRRNKILSEEKSYLFSEGGKNLLQNVSPL